MQSKGDPMVAAMFVTLSFPSASEVTRHSPVLIASEVTMKSFAISASRRRPLNVSLVVANRGANSASWLG